MGKTFGPYPALVVAVHDGDTCTLDIDLGFDHIIRGLDFENKTRLACRVFGINAPELATPAGKEARHYAQTLLPLLSKVTVVSHGWDKYGGRFDGDITTVGGLNFGQAMIEAGMADPMATAAFPRTLIEQVYDDLTWHP